MPKNLSDILKGVKKSSTTALTTGENPGVDYADKMKDTRDFVAQHSVEKHADRVGNEDDVYKGSTKKAKMERHGHEPKPKDIKVYNKNQQVGQPENMKEEIELDEAGSQYRSTAGSGKNTNPNLSRLARKLAFEKPKSFRPPGEKSKAENREMLDAEVAKFMKKGGKIQKEEADLDEGKDPREYGYEGDMAITQLKTICRHAEHLMKMMKPDTDLPEWVQAKITKAEDYISTAHDYLMSEMNEEVEELDERVKQNKINKNAAIEKIGANARKANDPMHLDVIGTGIRQDVADKIRGRELSSGRNRREVKEENKFTEAKCNMTEAGKMCEVHGMKACPKEEDESSQDKEPRYSGKKEKPGRKLLTDKKNIEEMATSQNQAIAARIALKHKKEGTMPPKGTASYSMMNMSTKQLHDYTHAEKGAPKKVEESISDQRSSRATASESARKEIHKAMLKRKEKVKEESAAAETPITFPVTNSREGFRV